MGSSNDDTTRFGETLIDPGDFQGRSKNDAIQAQTQAAQMADQTQRYMYDTTRGDFAPYRQAGTDALSQLSSGNFMDNWKGDPGYQFRMQQGMNALQNSAAAKGSLNSGATLKALTQYGQNFASNEYGNAYNREFSRLSNLAGMGQASAAQTAASGQNMANQVSGSQAAIGNATAAADLAQANRMSGMVGQGAGIAAMAFCDERLKTDIRKVDPAELAELRASLEPKHYKYVSEAYGEGEWVGVMAQALQKTKLGRTCVFTDDSGHLRVHLNKLLSLLVATFALEAA